MEEEMVKRTVADEVTKFRKLLDGQHYVDCPCGVEVRIPDNATKFVCPSCGHHVEEASVRQEKLLRRAESKQD
jgi:predicted RNA-binding Zn-ribbon protein involved in translation (DUF1610 family)